MKLKLLKLNNTSSEVKVDVATDALAEFNLDYTAALVSRVRNQALKQGTKHAKDRAEVKGHGKKPYKQKHTGNARQGSTKGPHMRGGGIAHGPKMDTTKLNLNKKMKKAFVRSLLLTFMNNESVSLIDLGTDGKALREYFNKQPRTLLVYDAENADLTKSIRNLENVKLLNMANINPFDLVSYGNVLIDAKSEEKVINILKG